MPTRSVRVPFILACAVLLAACTSLGSKLEAPDLEVVGEAADSAELLAQLAAQQPNVVLLEWDLPGQPTEDLLPAVRGLDHRLEVIILSGRPELEPRARAAGADAFVSLCDPPQRLLAALQAIEGGREA